jgi:aspartate-semialdehyde dehydrogenase
MPKNKHPLKIAIVNSGDIFAKELINVIESRELSVSSIDFISPLGTEGKIIHYKNKNHLITPIFEYSFLDTDLAFFFLQTEDIDKYIPYAISSNTYIIDMLSSLHMDENILLAIPEINKLEINKNNKKIVCSPNSLAIQLSMILYPILNLTELKRVIVSVNQSVSSKGDVGIDALSRQTVSLFNFQDVDESANDSGERLAFNCIPSYNQKDKQGYTQEEIIIGEQVKHIIKNPDLGISINIVTVPVFHCDSMFINIETKNKLSKESLKNIYAKSPGITVMDDGIGENKLSSSTAANRDEVFIGIIREDLSTNNGINIWCVMDNLRKGSALNAVQIAEYLISINFIPLKALKSH